MIAENIDYITTQKAIAEHARATGMINMAENFSMKDPDSELSELLQKNIVPYANEPSSKFGLPELRTTISKRVNRAYDFEYNPETEISITPGIKSCVFATLLALLKEGDEVIIFEPAHKSYDSAVNITGARSVYVELKAPDYTVDWEDVQKAVNPQTRMIIINSPHFPTGSTMSELDMLRLQKIINGTNILILSDESFEHLVFDKEMHQSVSLYPKLRERSVVVSSFNETLNIKNWHIGYCMSTAKLMSSIRKVISVLGEGVGTPYQKALVEYLNDWKGDEGLAAYYQHKRDLFIHALEDSIIEIVPSKATYYQLIKLKDKKEWTSVDFALKLLKDNGIAAVPLSFYYHQKTKSKYLRMNLSLPDDELLSVANTLKDMV